MIRSADFGGPATFVALEAVQSILRAMERPPLAEVSRAAVGCVFEETNHQTDEATAAQIIELLGAADHNK